MFGREMLWQGADVPEVGNLNKNKGENSSDT